MSGIFDPLLRFFTMTIIRGTDTFCGFLFFDIVVYSIMCTTYNQVRLCIPLSSSYVKIHINQVECTKWMSVLPVFWLYFHWKWFGFMHCDFFVSILFRFQADSFRFPFPIQKRSEYALIVVNMLFINTIDCYFVIELAPRAIGFLIQSPKKRERIQNNLFD